MYTKVINGLHFESHPIWEGKNLSYEKDVFLIGFEDRIFTTMNPNGKAKGTNIIHITQSLPMEICILYEKNPKGKIGDFMIENYSPDEFLYENIFVI